MSSLLKFAVATAMLTASVGLSQAQQGRSIEVIPAATEGAASQEPAQTFAQAPEAPAAQAPAEPAAPEQQAVEPAAPPQVAPQQAAPAPKSPHVLPPRFEHARPIPAPAPKHVEKCQDDKPVYGHYAPRYQTPTYHAPRYQEPRYERHSYAPRYEYAPQHNYGGYGYRRGY